MPNEHIIRCGTACEKRAIAGEGLVTLSQWRNHANVFVKIEDAERGVRANLSEPFLDLIDLAAYVYTADQAVSRGGPADKEFGAAWRREFHFHVPVRLPDLWNSALVQTALCSALSLLSEDVYHFRFDRLTDAPSRERYIPFERDRLGGPIDEVALFSGGLDSLAGAAQRIMAEGKRLMLLHHRSNPKLVPQVGDLVKQLGERRKGAQPAFVPVRVHKAQGLTKDNTQRARSFLYTSLAAALATAMGLGRFSIYENGVTSINLPPATQVVGSRASRTTHPLVLSHLESLFSLLAGHPFVIDRPFEWHTKADVVRTLAQVGVADLIELTRSCAHPRQSSNEQPHCGVCSQCIDRRFGVLAAGQEDRDPEDRYAVDLLTGVRLPGVEQTLIAVYAETANQISDMDAPAFFARFGEASRPALGWTDRAAVSQSIYQLLQRHAAEVNQVIEQGQVRYRREVRRRELPPTCLLCMVFDPGEQVDDSLLLSSHQEPSLPSDEDNVFRLRGGSFQIRYAGRPEFFLPASKGARYLHLLLQRPGQPIPLAQLVALEGGKKPAAPTSPELLHDESSLAGIQARLEQLQIDLAEARAGGNALEVQELEQELSELLAETMKHKSRGHKVRDHTTAEERLRKAVRAVIREAIRHIRHHDKVLAEHLKSSVACGDSPCYSPQPLIRWIA